MDKFPTFFKTLKIIDNLVILEPPQVDCTRKFFSYYNYFVTPPLLLEKPRQAKVFDRAPRVRFWYEGRVQVPDRAPRCGRDPVLRPVHSSKCS